MSARLLLLALALLGLVACSGGAAASPTPPVPSALPSAPALPDEAARTVPPATLADDAGQQQAVIGSYCWYFDSEAIECLDPLVVQAPTAPLTVAPAAPLTFTLPSEPLTMVTMRVLAWQPVEGEGSADATLVAPDAPLLASGDLEPSATIRWEAPPEPGEYLLDMMTVYENGGTIAYGWHLLVQP